MLPKHRIDGYMTGMLGLYLTAVELVKRGFIVSPTSRSAMGADLLVTNKHCSKAWSVQVKTISSMAKRWPVSREAKHEHSRSHIYIFVRVPRSGHSEPSFYVVPSKTVAPEVETFNRPHSTWYAYAPREKDKDNWRVFGSAAT